MTLQTGMAMSRNNGNNPSLAVFFYFAAMGYAAFLGLTAPYHNWDMLGYVGNVLRWSETNAEALYQQIYADVAVSTEDWIIDQFRANPLSATAENMVKQLPFYAVKPLYLGLMWLLHQIGFALSTASSLIAALSFGALAVWLWRWQPRNAPHWVWLATIVALTWLYEWPMAALARFSTPDSLSIVLTIGALWFWLERRRVEPYFLFALLALLARPDTIVLTGTLAAYFTLLAPPPQRMELRHGIPGMALLLGVYFLAHRYSGVYSWELMFTYAFLNKIPDPEALTGTLTPALYQQVIMATLPMFLADPRMVALMIISTLGLILGWQKPGTEHRLWRDLLLLTWAALAVRFAIFPAWGEARYYYAYDLLMLLAALELGWPYIAACAGTGTGRRFSSTAT